MTTELGLLPEPPVPTGDVGLRALAALVRHRDLLPVLSVLRAETGDIFRIPLKSFNAVVLSGPDANDFVFDRARSDLRWHQAGDPVARLLRHGVLMEDGALHERLRSVLHPPLARGAMPAHVDAMWRWTDQVSDDWQDGRARDMLGEMRRTALLIVMWSLFRVDFTPYLEALLPAILKAIDFISPGIWVLSNRLPRPGFATPLGALDQFLYDVIRARRRSPEPASDLLGAMVAEPDFTDDLIRDQMMTMLIAGHDTSTALLAWTLYLLGSHPLVLERVRAEVDAVVGQAAPAYEHLSQLRLLDQVVRETLRLYPPIHLGSRRATTDLAFQGYRIPAGTRVLYSIYLSHRDPRYWPEPDEFRPERFAVSGGEQRASLAYVPFGGGRRACIGLSFCQVESKVVLARLLQRFEFELQPGRVRPHMGATLEPHPGVMMTVRRRRQN